MIKIFAKGIEKGIVTARVGGKELDAAGAGLKNVIDSKFGRSFRVRQVDTGSCGACESEITAATNPIYDIQRFGIDIVASPRHADALLVTGPVSLNMELALKRTYEAMPGPKYVITFGDCALDGGKCRGAYYVLNGVKDIVPVSAHIPGCPPDPETLIKTLIMMLK